MGLEKWMATLLPAHPAEKSAADLGTVSIHRLRSAKVWVRWWGSGMLVGAYTGPTNYSQSRYDPGMDIEKKKELWDRLENEPERAYRAFESYRNLPSAERTVIAAYRHHTGNPDAVKPSDTYSGWSRQFAWRERAAAYDAHIDRLREKSIENAVQQEAEEQARAAREDERPLQRVNDHSLR